MLCRHLSLHTSSFKESMSRIASQAMILTSAVPEGSTDISELHGMTLLSVTSLSVKPRTLIQFNLQVPSATSIKLHELGWFAVHLLPPIESSVSLARNFSRGSRYLATTNPQGTTSLVYNSSAKEKSTKPFTGLNQSDFCFSSDIYSQDGGGPFYSFSSENSTSVQKLLKGAKVNIPLLKSSERIFLCRQDRFYKVDDHEIWIGEVKDILLHNDYHHERVDTKSGGLLFFNKGFHGLGSKLRE